MLTRTLSILGGVALLAMSLSSPLAADQWDKKTVITVTEKVRMPNIVLEPGKYVFKLLDSPSNRHIVQIFNADQSQLITTILAIPNYRLRPTGESTFQFWETPAGEPTAMRAWFYPGNNFGQEFAYPKTLSVHIAKAANAPVPTIPDEISDVAQLKTTPVVVVDATGKEAPLPATEVVVSQNTRPSTPAPVLGGSEPTKSPEASPSAVPATLPQTASPYPLIALFGLASLATFGVISRLSRRA